jgi:hypothetical protein
MTLPSSGAIAISNVNVEIGQSSTYTDNLQFLNGLLLSPAGSPNMAAFYSQAYFQNTTQGNCANGNCTNNCNCGNIQCNNCFISGYTNCVNCQSQKYLQANCNCGPAGYNCVTSQTASYNCNCACNCSKIVCANLYEKGLMSPDIWSADQAYGKLLRKTDKRVYRGYIRWARIVTMWMDGKGPTFMPWIKHEGLRNTAQQAKMMHMAQQIGTPWSEHMAYLMGTLNTDNTMGRNLMRIGTVLCRVASYIPYNRSKEKRHGLATTWTIWVCLYFSYYTASFITAIDKKLSIEGVKKWMNT